MSEAATILVYSTCGLSLPHLAIEREIIEKHLLGFSRKVLLKCDASFDSCYFNPLHNMLACALCKKRTRDFIETPFKFDKVYTIENAEKSLELNFEEFKDVYGLMNYSYKGIDIGRGIGSSMISIKRDVDLDINHYKNYIIKLLEQAAKLVDQIDLIVKREKVTDVLLFNGRFFEQYPILAYCKKRGLNYYTHEKGANFKNYQFIKNNTVHSLIYRKQQLDEVWESFEGDPVITAQKWYEDKKSGNIKTEANFTGEQKASLLPDGFDKGKHNIVIFNSSEDEYKSIKEWQHDLFTDQVDIITRVCQGLIVDKEIKLYLRFHPNMKGLADKQLSALRTQNLTNLTIIIPESPVSSYKLMLEADKVLSFGSRTSIEAAYWGIPSVIYGKSFYQSLASLYNPLDFKALIETLLNKRLKPKKGKDLLQAALFLQERGFNLTYADIKSKNEVYYKGEKMISSVLSLPMSLSFSKEQINIWKENLKLFKNQKLGLKTLKDLI